MFRSDSLIWGHVDRLPTITGTTGTGNTSTNIYLDARRFHPGSVEFDIAINLRFSVDVHVDPISARRKLVDDPSTSHIHVHANPNSPTHPLTFPRSKSVAIQLSTSISV